MPVSFIPPKAAAMTAACPKCAHPKPEGNPTTCPSCGVVFAKLATAQHAMPQMYAKPRRRFGLLHVILIALFLAGSGIATWVLIKHQPAARIDHPDQRAAIANRKQTDNKRSETQQALNDMTAILRKWEDASALAGATSRMSLATPVASLQAIRREMQSLIVPPCADESKALAVQSMETAISGFMAFMSSAGDDYQAKTLMHRSAVLMQQSNEAGEACNKTY